MLLGGHVQGPVRLTARHGTRAAHAPRVMFLYSLLALVCTIFGMSRALLERAARCVKRDRSAGAASKANAGAEAKANSAAARCIAVAQRHRDPDAAAFLCASAASSLARVLSAARLLVGPPAGRRFCAAGRVPGLMGLTSFEEFRLGGVRPRARGRERCGCTSREREASCAELNRAVRLELGWEGAP